MMPEQENSKDDNDYTKVVSKLGKREPKPKKVFWITRAIAEDHGREAILRATFIEFIIYAFFLTCVTIYVLGVRSTSVYHLTKGLLQQFTERKFKTINDADIRFRDIKTAADFWMYAEGHLIDSFFWESKYGEHDLQSEIDENAMNILYENKVLGVPRIRQVKVRNDSCIIHDYFRKLFVNCFDTYSKEDEDKESFGPGEGTAWVFNEDDETASLPYWGKISTYEGDGFYVDLPKNKNASVNMIQELKTNLWITRGTRAVFVDFTVYNANLNIFAVCKLLFEFPSTGGVITTADFHSVRLIRFLEPIDWFIFGCEILFYLFILYYLIEEVREIVYFRLAYFTKFWTYIDWTIILCSISSAVISVKLILSVSPAIKAIENNPDKYGNLEYLSRLHIENSNLFAVDLFFIFVKIFKFLNFNRTMGQLNNTLRKCARDVLGFSIMFFIIFFAFSELGYLLFGSQVENFSSFGIAMFTLLRTILGDFDYDEIEEANRILAPIYFLSYIFLVFFVLLNMFLAIINDTYADVKTEIAIAPDEMQMTEYIGRSFKRFLRRLGCNFAVLSTDERKSELNATIRQIREALKKCGFSDLEIEMFFARYNIDPLAEVKINDVEVLLAELENILKDNTAPELSKYVKISDFVEQQNRLEQIDRTIGLLVEQVKNLLSKLDHMENVRKVPKN